MKKLICVKDIEACDKQEEKVFYIDNDTIITPSAKDLAKARGIVFSTEANCCKEKTSEQGKAGGGQIDSKMIETVLRSLVDKGLLTGMFDTASDKPYTSETDCSGIKIVRGKSVKYEVLETGNPADKVFYQELINAEDGSSMNAGFITIEGCNFDWETACEELYHIVEGTLTIAIDGKVYTAIPGDSVFFPKGIKLEFGSPNKMKAFYATY